MIVQHYSVEVGYENIENYMIGQFVFADDETDDITGFISDMTQNEIEVMLFEPGELVEFEFRKISKTVDWLPRLLEIFEEFPDVKEFWDEVVGTETYH